jgi:phenylacetate-CoA ligase
MSRTNIPYYYKSLDWESFVRDYPPPAEFSETVYLWPRDKIEKMQNERFKKAIEFAWQNPFYKNKWTEAGLAPKDIRGIKDIHKIPIVSSVDFKAEIETMPPFGAHQGISRSIMEGKPLKIQSSGGTTGKPRPTFYGPIEWEIGGLSQARAMYIQGARPGDICQSVFTCSTHNMGWCLYVAAHHWLGVIPITTGSGVVTPTRRQLEIAREWGTDFWASGPEYLGYLAKKAPEEAGFDVRELKTKFITTFLGPDLSGQLRKELEESWGCDVYDNYGTHETALTNFECKEKAGMHFNEDLGYFEIVDTDTLEPVKTGEEGDLIWTSFYRQHPPLIRYWLKDRVRIFDGGKKCVCGSYLIRMDHFLGRSDDMVKLRGTNMYPMACLDSIKADQRSTGEWICVVTRTGEGVNATEEMTVKVEYKDEHIDKENFKRKLEQALKSDLGVRVTVEPVPSGSLAPLTGFGKEGKAKRLLDLRPEPRKK